MDSVDTSQTNQKRSKGYKGIGMEGPVARWYLKILLRRSVSSNNVPMK